MTVHLDTLRPEATATLPPDTGRQARAQLAAVADGNGLRADQIRIAREDHATAQLEGEISVAFSHRLQQEQKPGRATTGTPADSEDIAREWAATRAAQLAHNPDLQQAVAAHIASLPAHGWGAPPARFNLGSAADDVFCVVSRCPSCTETLQPACAICAGTAETTKVLTVKYGAELSFTLWRQGADVSALQAAEKLGVAALASDDLADIFISPLQADGTRLRATATAVLPVSKIEFSLEGRFVTAVIAGKKGTITQLDPVLDKFIKPGVSALLKLSRGPLAVDSLVSTAMKYRLVRHVMQSLLVAPRASVYRDLIRDYPVGVSDKYLRAAVKYAAEAQEALLVAPRKRGLLLGLLAGLLLALGYLAGLRPLVSPPAAALACDVLVWAVLSTLIVFIIRTRAARHLVAITRAPHRPAQLPPARQEGKRAPVLMALLFFVAATLVPVKPPYAQPVYDATTAALGPLLSSLASEY